jgi:hypothetical protein
MRFDKVRGGGTLIAIPDSVSGAIRRTDMELAEKRLGFIITILTYLLHGAESFLRS